MFLDPITLAGVTVFVTAILGGLFLLSWLQDRRTLALAWWAGGFIASAGATALFGARGHIPDALSIVIANAAMLLAHGLLWTGVRAFEGRQPLRMPLAAGPLVWMLACQVPAFAQQFEARIVLASSLAASYSFAACLELWAGRREGLISRYPALCVLGLHGLLQLGKILAAFVLPLPPGAELMQTAWPAVLCAQGLFFAVSLGFLCIALTKERRESEQRVLAATDALTGIANRRAFFEAGSHGLAQSVVDSRPAALLLLDLDHFKRINDTYGHGEGDRILTAFARMVRTSVPASAVLGRLGGEEFGCILFDTQASEALVAADRLRRELATAGPEENPLARVTVSVGISTTSESGYDLEGLLASADQALYRAKSQGRNRVEHNPVPVPRVDQAA